jgi:hypothetical protein
MTTMSDDTALRMHLGVDDSGAPTLEARQTVALIRHPHTPWSYGEAPEERLGALLTSPLALSLRNTAWQGLLANELRGKGPVEEPDRDLAERARSIGTSIPQLVTLLGPVLDLFDGPALAFENIAAEHVRILFPEFYERAERWSELFNEHMVDSTPAEADERATARVVESLIDTDLAPDDWAHWIGQFREAQVLLASGKASRLLDGLRVRDTPLRGWAEWAALVTERLIAHRRDPDASGQSWIDPASDESDPRSPGVFGQLLEAFGNEPISPTSTHPGIGMLRYLRRGYRYWHVWGTYSQLYDALLATPPALDPCVARILADHVYGYLFIGYHTVHDSVPLPEITELSWSGWEVRTQFPELADLMSVSRPEPLAESFARSRKPAALGLAPIIGEIAELLAFGAAGADLSLALTHLGSVPSGSTHTWLATLSADLVLAAAAPEFNPEP